MIWNVEVLLFVSCAGAFGLLMLALMLAMLGDVHDGSMGRRMIGVEY